MPTDKPPRRPATVRIATWSATHPWRAVLAWVGFVAIVFTIGTAMGTKQTDFSDFWVGEAGQAEALAESADIAAPAVEHVLITDADGLDVVAAKAAAADLAKRMGELSEVADVSEPRTAADGESVLVSVTIAGPEHEAKEHLDPLLKVTAAIQDDHPDLTVRETGGDSISRQLDAQLGSDLGHAELFTMPITLLILFAVFGSLLLAGVPLLLAISSILASMGTYAIASHFFPDAGGAVTSVLVMMGMAVGVDYSLFYVKRVREERERDGSLSPAAAVALAAETSGHAILVSGLAVVVSMAGLFLSGDVIFESIATACAIVVAIAMISSLTVLPALLAKMGPRVDGRRRRRGRGKSRLWPTLLRPAMDHPVASVLIGGLVLVALAAPALGMKVSVEGKETFPKSLPAVAAYDDLVAAFPDQGVAHKVVARVGTADADGLRDAMTGLWDKANDDPMFVATTKPRLSVAKDGRTAALELPVPYPTSDERAGLSLELLRTAWVPDALGDFEGVDYAVSGEPAYAADYSALQTSHLFWVVGFILVATFAMMFLAFRSAVLAGIGLVLNLLSGLAVWGALVLVFQGTWAEGLLGFHSSGFIGSRTPLMVFVILFGLSIDYQIFVVSRIREHALAGEPTRRAAYNGVLSSAGVVSSAALIMVSVFAAFMLIDRIEMKQIGFALALGVLLDAVVVRILILPALLSLLGGRSWWPARLPEPKAAKTAEPVRV